MHIQTSLSKSHIGEYSGAAQVQLPVEPLYKIKAPWPSSFTVISPRILDLKLCRRQPLTENVPLHSICATCGEDCRVPPRIIRMSSIILYSHVASHKSLGRGLCGRRADNSSRSGKKIKLIGALIFAIYTSRIR